MPKAIRQSLSYRQVNSKYSRIENKSSFGQCRVDVEFAEGLSPEQVITNISQASNPQVIIWYIGSYGLREVGVQFYKNFLIAPVLSENSEATFWLVDLTAWSAFKNPQSSIENFNSCCDAIEKFLDKRIKCIRSSEIFKKIREISEKEVIGYFRKALHRKFISHASQDFPNKNIRIKDILPNCPIVSDWYDYDVSKSYSILQYLEGCLLIDEIFMQRVINNGVNDIEIVLALPNDELKYYRDNRNSFQKDVEFLILKRCAALNLENIHLQIKFIAFKYGSQPNHRPYNAPGKIIKNGNLSYEDVVGRVKNNGITPERDFIYASRS